MVRSLISQGAARCSKVQQIGHRGSRIASSVPLATGPRIGNGGNALLHLVVQGAAEVQQRCSRVQQRRDGCCTLRFPSLWDGGTSGQVTQGVPNGQGAANPLPGAETAGGQHDEKIGGKVRRPSASRPTAAERGAIFRARRGEAALPPRRWRYVDPHMEHEVRGVRRLRELPDRQWLRTEAAAVRRAQVHVPSVAQRPGPFAEVRP